MSSDKMRLEHAVAAVCGGVLLLSASCGDDRPRVHRGDPGGSGGSADGGSGGGASGGEAGSAEGGEAGDSGASVGGEGGTLGGSGGAGGAPLTELNLTFEPIDLDEDPTFVTHFEFLPGSSEFLASTRQGRVLHYELSGDTTHLLGEFEITDLHVEQDCGIISFTFDPDFEDNGFIYFGYCLSAQESGIFRYRFDPSAYDEIDATRVEILQAGDSLASSAIHSVGKMGFDEAGNLWATFGEKGRGSNAQNTSNPLGSLIRVRPLADGGYEAPDPPNPEFDDSPTIPLIYAYGLRSPWTALLDSRGRYWFGDVGASGDESIEEINLASGAGVNFGWSASAGPCQRNCDQITDPVRWWARTPTSEFELEDPEVEPVISRVAWVGVEYSGVERDRYQGLMTDKVLYGDMCLGYVRGIEVNGSGEVVFDRHLGHLAGASAWKIGPDGFVYAITYARCTHSTNVDLAPGKLMRARLAVE